ncbi:hypothetical protein HU200_019689 [Digitaria exilis]|uniref:Uncharacterized protein n=1 Tax=Digitaria exilis TaxID=1010633 RepID=A0A835KHI0_9POAL|nr:hypothetical protein HU200_019689 [Digitaria exilis]
MAMAMHSSLPSPACLQTGGPGGRNSGADFFWLVSGRPCPGALLACLGQDDTAAVVEELCCPGTNVQGGPEGRWESWDTIRRSSVCDTSRAPRSPSEPVCLFRGGMGTVARMLQRQPEWMEQPACLCLEQRKRACNFHTQSRVINSMAPSLQLPARTTRPGQLDLVARLVPFDTGLGYLVALAQLPSSSVNDPKGNRPSTRPHNDAAAVVAAAPADGCIRARRTAKDCGISGRPDRTVLTEGEDDDPFRTADTQPSLHPMTQSKAPPLPHTTLRPVRRRPHHMAPLVVGFVGQVGNWATRLCDCPGTGRIDRSAALLLACSIVAAGLRQASPLTTHERRLLYHLLSAPVILLILKGRRCACVRCSQTPGERTPEKQTTSPQIPNRGHQRKNNHRVDARSGAAAPPARRGREEVVVVARPISLPLPRRWRWRDAVVARARRRTPSDTTFVSGPGVAVAVAVAGGCWTLTAASQLDHTDTIAADAISARHSALLPSIAGHTRWFFKMKLPGNMYMSCGSGWLHKYILQEIHSPQSRTVVPTVRNNLSISWANGRKYPYSNPGTHPHVGPTSSDHPMSYRLRPRLSPTQQARGSHADRRPPALTGAGSPAARSPDPDTEPYGTASLPRTRLAPKLNSYPCHLASATTQAAAHDGDTPSGQTPATHSRRTHLRAPAAGDEHNATPNASCEAPQRPSHRARRRTQRRAAQPANPSPQTIHQQDLHEPQPTLVLTVLSKLDKHQRITTLDSGGAYPGEQLAGDGEDHREPSLRWMKLNKRWTRRRRRSRRSCEREETSGDGRTAARNGEPSRRPRTRWRHTLHVLPELSSRHPGAWHNGNRHCHQPTWLDGPNVIQPSVRQTPCLHDSESHSGCDAPHGSFLFLHGETSPPHHAGDTSAPPPPAHLSALRHLAVLSFQKRPSAGGGGSDEADGPGPGLPEGIMALSQQARALRDALERSEENTRLLRPPRLRDRRLRPPRSVVSYSAVSQVRNQSIATAHENIDRTIEHAEAVLAHVCSQVPTPYEKLRML